MASIRCTADVATTSRMPARLAVARLNARTRAFTPAESQNVVVLMSTTSNAVPRLMIERRSSRTWPTFDISI